MRKLLVDRSTGIEFVVKVEPTTDERQGLIENAVKVIRSRLEAINMAGEVTADTNSSDQIVVKIFGGHDLANTQKFLFTANQLELREMVTPSHPEPIKVYATRSEAERSAGDIHEIIPYSEGSGEMFLIVIRAPVVTGAGIINAYATSRTGDKDDSQVTFVLNQSDGQKFGEWTGKNIGKYMAIMLDKKIISMPYIHGQIFTSGEIDGKFTKEEADNLALSLKSGYLPAKMMIVKEERFGN